LNVLRKGLEDKDKSVRVEVANAMLRLGDHTGGATLERSLQDGDWRIRLQVIQGLGDSINGVAIGLAEMALGDQNTRVRIHASKTILLLQRSHK
jgi:HEAT repeat protein